MYNLIVPSVVTTTNFVPYRFVEKTYNTKCYSCTCILIDKNVADTWATNKYTYSSYPTNYSSFDDYFKDRNGYIRIDNSLRKLCVKIETFYFDTPTNCRLTIADEAKYKQMAIDKFVSTFEENIKHNTSLKVYCSAPYLRYITRYKALILSEKEHTIYHFSVNVENRKQAEQIIYKDFNIIGIYSKANKNKTFKEIMAQNGYDVISFATDNSREE